MGIQHAFAKLTAAGLAGLLLAAIPALAGEDDPAGKLLTRQGSGQQAAARVVAGLLAAAAGSDAAAREAAAQAAGRLGPQDMDLAPHFVGSLATGGRGPAAELSLRALGRLGSSDIAVLRAIAARSADQEPAVRAACARALSSGGHDAGAAVAVLAGMLTDREPAVRREAAVALGRLGRGARPALQVMVNALVDREPSVRRAAALGLGRTGDTAVVNALLQFAAGCREDDDFDALFRAFLALGEAAAPARAALHKLVYDRRERWGRADIAGLGALARMTGQYDPYGRDLVGFLDKAELKDEAALMLAKAPAAAGSAKDALLAGLKDAGTAAACAIALGRIGAASRGVGAGQGSGIATALVGLLDSDDPEVAAAALCALGDIGDAASAPEVTRRADRFGDVAEVWLQYALCRLKQEPGQAMGRLKTMSEDPWEHRALAGAVLRYLEAGGRGELHLPESD
jgi:HEAT repeat protein